jgi:hypothetical protein
MTETAATGYDILSSRSVPEAELQAFLLDCFGIAEHELFIGRRDRVAEVLRDVPEDVVFAAFCTYDVVRGHFAMSVEVGIEGRLVDRLGRRAFAERFAASFGAFVLFGDDEPADPWTVILADGSRLLAEMDEDDDRFVLTDATAPVPGVPGLRRGNRLGRGTQEIPMTVPGPPAHRGSRR